MMDDEFSPWTSRLCISIGDGGQIQFSGEKRAVTFSATEFMDLMEGLRRLVDDMAMERSAGDTVPPRTAPVTPRERIESLMLSGAGQLARIFELERRVNELERQGTVTL